MNNNKLFDLDKFRKIKNNYYNNKDSCNKYIKKWGKEYITNPKFNTTPIYNQKYYTAGDYEDFDRYGILSSLYYLSQDDYKINNNILKKNNNSDIFKLYKNIDIESIINTFTYIFEKMKKGIFIIIHNNKLVLFLPFSNNDYINNWYDKIYFSLEEQELLKENDYNKIQDILRNNIVKFMKKHPEQFEKGKKINFNRKEWHANNCVFRNLYPKYEGDLNINIFKNMFDELCKNRKVPNVQFFINYRDSPILKKDLTEPFHHLFDSKNVKIEEKYNFKKFAPILSQSITDDYADILMPTNDDWLINSSKFFTNNCKNSYIKNNNNNKEWKNKKNICVFRGSATGCGITVDNNMRLKAAQMSIEYPKLLDAGITDWKPRDKKYSGNPIQIINPEDFNFRISDKLSRLEQSSYKYILNIDGYVSAFRLSSELRMNSVILIAESDYKMWYSHLLVPYEHFVPVKNDLSDLISQIKWCIKNDKKCEKIAINSGKFYEKYLTIDGLFDYLQKTMINIYLNRHLKNPLVFKKVKKNIAVITLFRAQKETNRDSQRKLFINYMNQVLPKYCNFHIYIIEQSQDDEKFSISKLKNIGFDISSHEKKYDAFLFTDIDHLFDYDLLPYCVEKPKYPMCLAYKGTRYQQNYKLGSKPFFGGTNIFSSKDFKKINGYSNNYQGWGYEDQSLLLKVNLSGINHIQYPKNGQIIDTESTQNLKKVELKNKTTFNETLFETLGFEKLLIESKYWKKNGLNNLDYKILKKTKINDNTTQIKVDLLLKQDREKYPHLFPIIKNMSTNEYKKFKLNAKLILKEYFRKIKVDFV